MTAITAPDSPYARDDTDVPIVPHAGEIPADRNFRLILTAGAGITLLILASIGVFLLSKSIPALRLTGIRFITDTIWDPTTKQFGMGSLLLGSIAIAIVGVVVAVPISLTTALMINEYAPQRLRAWLTTVIDLLATVPSIVYGFWGIEVISNLQIGPARWIAHYFGFIAFLRTPSPGDFQKSVFATGLVCALTIVPIVTSVSREVMAQTPRDVCEAALGLGGTRWGMVTEVIWPFSRNGIVGAILLGFGRGLGETMIPFLMLSSVLKITPDILGPNGLGSTAGNIAANFVDVSPLEQSAMILSALLLFATALFVSYLGRAVVRRAEVGSK